MERLTDQYQINETNINLRKQFILLSRRDIRTFQRLARWAALVAEKIAKEFYGHQFRFPPTPAFLKRRLAGRIST